MSHAVDSNGRQAVQTLRVAIAGEIFAALRAGNTTATVVTSNMPTTVSSG